LDVVLGLVFAVNTGRGVFGRYGKGKEVPVMTGWLNTRFERPVFTGGGGDHASDGNGEGGRSGVVMVAARLVKREGRKFWLEGEVSGEDGAVLARGESLFVMVREKL
jgi:hypothetical protein